jgi:hypothetical protein
MKQLYLFSDRRNINHFIYDVLIANCLNGVETMAKIRLNVLNTVPVNGYVIYDGPSRLNGKDIVVIATGFAKASHNEKTGDLIQVWIMSKDSNPIDSLYKGSDDSVCGDCKHRPKTDSNPDGWGTCYVNVGQGPYAVYKAYKNNKYPVLPNVELFKDKYVRFGTYGDPAAIPIELIRSIVGICSHHTAYTHQWKNCDKELLNYCMASVDTPKEYKLAQSLGWRTFRVRLDSEELDKNERVCPASSERKLVTCEQCMACHGGGNSKASIAIIAHGSWRAKRFFKIRKKQIAKKGYKNLIKQLGAK